MLSGRGLSSGSEVNGTFLLLYRFIGINTVYPLTPGPVDPPAPREASPQKQLLVVGKLVPL